MKTNLKKSAGRLLILAIAILISGKLSASVIFVNGAITFNTNWTADTVKVNGDVTVNSGVTLSIDAGTLIIFQGHYKLNVQGVVKATGTSTDKIRFTISDTTSFSNMTLPNGGWYGIKFFNNTSTDTSVFEHCIFEYGKANGSNEDGMGGAIYVSYYNYLVISNCSFYSNAASTNGGAIYLKKSSPLIKWCTFTMNKSSSGAGIYNSSGAAKIYNNVLSFNFAGSGGGGIFCADTTNCLIINNLIYGNMGQLGGGIGFYVSDPQLNNNTITYNRATHGGAMSCITSSPTLKNCVLYGNVGTGTGNQVSLLNPGCNPNFYYSDVYGGTAAFGGSGAGSYSGTYLNNISANPVFEDTTGNNYLIKSSSPCLDAGTTDTTGLFLLSMDIAGNPRINMGRIDMGAYERQQNIDVCGHITQNTHWNADTVKITCDVIVDNGIKLTIAPAVYVEVQGTFSITVDGSLTASGASGSEITFTPKNTGIGWKGFIFNNTSALNDPSEFNYCKIYYARNTGDGGAFFIDSCSLVKISHCGLYHNFANNGGGIYLNNSSITVDNTIFDDNNANISSGAGGAVYFSNASSLYSNQNIFKNNKAYRGGALYDSLSMAYYFKNIFTNNEAGIGAGFFSDTSVLMLNNSIITNNTALQSGGGLYLNNTEAMLVNTDVVYNLAATGGGLYINNASPEIENTILYSNIGTTSGNQVCISDSNSFPEFYFSDVMGDTTSFCFSGTATHFNGIYQSNIDTIPVFITPPGGAGASFQGLNANFALDPCSHLYNKGNTDTVGLHLPSTDFGGNQRIYGGIIDIGAYELIKPQISLQPQNQSVCAGDTAIFWINVTASFNVNYQWEYSSTLGLIWNPAPGQANDSVYYVNNVQSSQNGYLYRCIVSAPCLPNLNSQSASLNVSSPPTINTQPISDTVCQNDNVSFTVGASGSGILYQWQQQSPGGATWSNCTGSSATQPTYTISNVSTSLNGYKYKCVITGNCPPDTVTIIVTLTVKALPSISSQPSNVSVCEGSNASFSVTASGTNITYLWEESTNGGSTWNTAPGTATNSTYNITGVTASMDGYKYHCIISGDCPPPVTSNNVTLNVHTEPIIVNQPQNTHVCVGHDTTISVTATGGNLSYQWKMKTPGSSVWVNATGPSALSAVYQINNPSLGMNNTWYRCHLHGNCPPDTVSDSIQLFVHNIPAVTLGPDTTILLSESIILDPGANYSSYLWSTSATTQTITVVGSIAGVGPHMYTVTVTNSYGCSNSDNIVVTVVDDTGIDIEANDGARFSLYPNPAVEVIYLSLNHATGPLNIVIRNLKGQIVQAYFFSGLTDTEEIDISNLAGGMYIAEINYNNAVYRNKIIKK